MDRHTRLMKFIESRQDSPFQYGHNDCCLFAADAVLAMTGIDLAKDLREYHSEFGALRVITENGGIESIVDFRLPRVPVVFAQRGDVILFNRGNPTLGVCLGDVIAAPGPDRLEYIPIAEAVVAWRS